MKYTANHDLHIHSHLSLCSNDPEQTTRRILQYALDNGLSTIAVTDHYWDETVGGSPDWYAIQNTAHVSQSLPLPQADGVRFLFGCETDLRQDLTLGISKQGLEHFDFIIIPTTHLHMAGFTINGDANAQERAEAWCDRLNAVLDMELPFHKIGIAHLACGLMIHNGQTQEVISRIPDSRLEALFAKAAARGVGIEINSDDFNFARQTPERVESTLHLFRIAKAQGCKFYFGSDAHHPAELTSAKSVFENAVDLLELCEDDKFIVP